MLGWALKRGGAKDASELGNNDLSDKQTTAPNFKYPDDTQIEQPDTPAPVFAVRALKTALFGTPAPRSYQPSDATDDMPDKKAPTAGGSDTPARPAGILLTPGTGTTRRKRVSFGHDVKAEANGLVEGDAAAGTRPKTRLTQALENSRKNKKPQSASSKAKQTGLELKDPDDVWEEVDDDRDPDVTVDLNEPHSRSGKYWKSCFESYHADAKAEMEKLVKYKQLAKSYAKMKDSEAMDLQQKLGEEQERVRKMEEKVAELSRNIHAGRAKGDKGTRKDSEMVAELQEQKALAAEYRQQVEELEEMLVSAGQEPDGDKRRRKAAGTTSPRTANTLIETNRELRKARTQLKEFRHVQDEVSRLKAELLAERQKSGKLAEENRKLAGDLSRSSSKVLDLEKKLDDSRNEARTKEREFRRLKSEHDQLKENAKARFSEAEQVVAKKNETISGLKDEIRSLKTENSERLASREEGKAQRRKSYSETTYSKRSQEKIPEDNTTKILDSIESRGRSSVANGLSLPQLSSNIHVDKEARHGESHKSDGHGDENLLVTSRALRHRITTDMGKNGSSSSVLSDRANLQETRRAEATTSSNRHSYPMRDTAEPSLPTLPRLGKGEDGHGLRRKSSKNSVHRKASEIRPSSADSEMPQIDLMQSHFARLGDTANTSTAWDISTVKTSLPAERRAAAIARLQRKKAERARSERAEGRNKENMPLA
jgi:hypothetical protein